MCIACGPLMKALNAGLGKSSRRLFLKGGAALAAGFGGALSQFACSGVQADTAPGDTLYSGGAVLTMTDANPTAEAVLVREGRIVAVGKISQVEAQARAPVNKVDLAGKALLPGFFDPHGHVVMIGLQALSANLLPPPDGEGNDITAIQRLLTDWIAKNNTVISHYTLVIGFGYDDSQLKEQRHPTREDLDAVSKDLPILIIHQSGHLGVLNSKALEVAGVTADTKNPPGGVFRRRDGGTEPNGVCEEYAFFYAGSKLLSRFDEDAYLAMIKAGAEFCASFGYTTMQEARAMAVTAAMLEKAAQKGLLPIDILVYPDILDAVDAIKPTKEYTNHYRIGGAKITIDGSPQGRTAWLTKPYFMAPPDREAGYLDYPSISKEKVEAAFDLAYGHNWQILTHANGDAAIDALIGAARQVKDKHGGDDRRSVLIHGQTTRLDQLPALKELGVLPSFFPMHTFYWGDWYRETVLGPERAETISPCGSARRLGMTFTSHTDAPVANPDSIRVLSATVTRQTRKGYVLGPDERVDAQTALKAMTIWAAHQHFEEATKGSLEPGKLADFVILDQNPLETAPEKLAALKVIETIKEGRSIYKAKG